MVSAEPSLDLQNLVGLKLDLTKLTLSINNSKFFKYFQNFQKSLFYTFWIPHEVITKLMRQSRQSRIWSDEF